MTTQKLKQVGKCKNLSQAQHIALTLVAQLGAGVPRRHCVTILQEIIERDEGKTPVSIRVSPDDRALTHEECDEIRREMAKGDKP